MIITHCYKIKPSQQQIAQMEDWLDLLRRHWNYALGQRLDWLMRTRCYIDRCSLISCPIGEIPAKVDYYSQQSELKETKRLFPNYKEIYSEVQQINLQRLKIAWERWLIPEQSGKRCGKPRFKKVGSLRSFSFSRVNHPKAAIKFDGKNIITTRIGIIPVVVHRPIPDGFVIQTATIVKKADGWYVCFSLKDDSVPELLPVYRIKTGVGVDVGLKELCVTSTGETFPFKRFYRKAQTQLARGQRKLSRKQKRSNNYLKQLNRVQRIHQKIQRQRKQQHYKIAHSLVNRYDLIAVEDLNIKGLARTPLSKSILDAGWGGFLTRLEAVAVKRGIQFVKVSAYGTTQECSSCGTNVPKDLSVRTHECPKCQVVLDRDENAALNIFNRALNEVGIILSACAGLVSRQPLKQETSRTEEYIQLSVS
ncbi:transposase [Limnoraphis robusta Tam1]|uniref:RNA-guided endonuclease InsQ/TnpB family protein n=1 Tax=Limnoraphis robusta TaxID=1118279 RepID=UPI002B220974|nr:transposase [Limnoraphis robusta]MEA5500738.1 transposase [Limnoraphis robusta BA-68 BA1]MEA5541761.1 transposase [Limnoraphis robusta Tam1]